jgi:hypothetical protein
MNALNKELTHISSCSFLLSTDHTHWEDRGSIASASALQRSPSTNGEIGEATQTVYSNPIAQHGFVSNPSQVYFRATRNMTN